MGVEETAPKAGDDTPKETPPPQATPEEEPPKMEEILTEEMLQSIVKGYNPELSLTSWKAEFGTKPGDNYMSIMYAVEMKLKGKGGSETLNVMVKTVPRAGFRVEMVNEMELFQKEANVYRNVLPVLEKAQEEKGIAKEEILRAWPKCYDACIDGQSDYLAMEDLKVLGYKMGNRQSGLNFNHCVSVLRTLARYHAISFAKYDGNQQKILECFPTLENPMFGKEEKNTTAAEMQKQMFPHTFKMLSGKLKDIGEDIVSSRLQKMADGDINGAIADLCSRKVDDAVITHGDCWVNNMLFKYSDQDTTANCPTDVMFIDFQICLASSRLMDVYYFLLTSVQLNVLKEREEDLLMTYYSEFTRFAEKLGVDTMKRGLTWRKLQEEANDFRLYGICMGLVLAPMFAAASEDIPDMDSITKEDFANLEEDTVTENGEGMAAFYKNIHGSALEKTKYIILEQLPQWSGSAPYL